MTGRAKYLDVFRAVIAPISVFVMSMQNLWFNVPSASLASRKELFQVNIWFFRPSLFYFKFVLCFAIAMRRAALVRAKLTFGLTRLAFVMFSAMKALAHHISTTTATTIKALDRAITDFRGRLDFEVGLALRAFSSFLAFAVELRRTFLAAGIAAQRPVPLVSFSAMSAYAGVKHGRNSICL
jgi:hypothetical protein